jgi:hypothetical protein
MNEQLKKWLTANAASCDYDVQIQGDSRMKRSIACYIVRGGIRVLIESWHAKDREPGWEVFVPATGSNEVAKTIEALDKLVNPPPTAEQLRKMRAELDDAHRDLRDSLNNWGIEDIRRAEKRVREAEAALEAAGVEEDED